MNLGSKARILIVDDTATNIKVLSDLLMAYGFEVLIAKDGKDALQKLQRVHPDLILLDVLMPGIDGFETCRLLKASSQTQDIPVIFMTALSDPIDKIKGLTLGAVDYVTKPLQHEEVIARISVHLRLRNLTKQLADQNALLQEEVRSRKLAERALRSSEEKFAKAFRSSPGSMTIVTLGEGRFLEVNQNFCALTHYAQEEIRGKTASELGLWVNQQERDRICQILERDGVISKQEIQLRTKVGEIRTLMMSAEVVQIDNTPCILGMHHDITDRKRAIADLSEKEQFLRSIYEGVGESIFVVEVLGNGEFRGGGINPAHAALTGYSSDYHQGKRMDQLFAPELAERLCQKYRACISAGKTLIYEEFIPFQDKDYWWLTNLTPLRNSEGRIHRLVGTCVDITDRKQMETDLQLAKEAADTANRAKSTFLANMSHELRTPLHAILGFAELLALEETLNDSQRESAEIINTSGEHLLALINDVLEVSKIEAGKAIVTLTPVNLRNLLSNLEELLQLRAEAKGLKLFFHLPQDLPPQIQTDEPKLRQILLNLLGNAIKFTDRGSVSLHLAIDFADAIDDAIDPDSSTLLDSAILPSPIATLRFKVEDTGVGIAPEEVEHLFEAFNQTEVGRRASKGTGLGLFISRQLLHLLGGDIQVSSAVDRGTCFQIEIPVQVPALSLEVTDLPAIADRRVIGLCSDQSPPRILVAEDVLQNRRLLVRLLSAVGFEVQEVADGQSAIECWQSWNPHLILMDMRMPIVDGYAATRQIKATAEGWKTTVIAVTANALDEERTAIFAAGCDDLLRKPFKENMLFTKLSDHLGIQYRYAN
jgi:PAS domain S-box-containing protein